MTGSGIKVQTVDNKSASACTVAISPLSLGSSSLILVVMLDKPVAIGVLLCLCFFVHRVLSAQFFSVLSACPLMILY